MDALIAPPTTEDVLAKLDAGRTGIESRTEVARWARSFRPSGIVDHVCRDIATQYALWALMAADVSEADLQTSGEPYFVRDVDLAEWAEELRCSAPPSVVSRGCRTFRAWQTPRGIQVQALVLGQSFDELVRVIDLPTLRGVDDLDYYEDLRFLLPSGAAVCVQLYCRSNRDPIVHLQCTVENAEQRAAELFDVLGIEAVSVRWWNAGIFPARINTRS